jgi:hypothetical protein
MKKIIVCIAIGLLTGYPVGDAARPGANKAIFFQDQKELSYHTTPVV